MGALIYPNAIANGAVADGDEVQANFDAVSAKFTASIDVDNLKNPNSIVEWVCGTFPDETGGYSLGYRLADPSGGGYGAVALWAAGENEIIDSVRYVDRQHTMVYGDVIADSSDFTAGEVFTVKVQRASGSPEPAVVAWTDVATATLVVPATANYYQRSIFTLTVATIPASTWVRVIVVNPAPVFSAALINLLPVRVRILSKVVHVD